MKPLDKQQLRGLNDLLQTAVEQGASAVERVHMETARRPFAILEQIPVLGTPSKGVHLVHDGLVKFSYGAVRAITRLVGRTADVAIDALPTEPPPEPPRGPEND